MHLVYDKGYNFGSPGPANLHPFDLKKYGRAWAVIEGAIGRSKLNLISTRPGKPITDDELERVHSRDYLASLDDASVIAQAVEVEFISKMPMMLINKFLLKPMRLACRGTILAARLAMEHGFAINLAGGYHHAKPGRGEGFNVYSDIALAAWATVPDALRTKKTAIAYIDLDVHQGNGVCYQFADASSFKIFDMYNASIYPAHDRAAIDRIDHPIPLRHGTSDVEYLERLTTDLPRFLDAIGEPELAIYNAGTDVLSGDPLGGLDVSHEAIVDRDAFVFTSLRDRGIPMVMVPSGGYTETSYRVLADSVLRILDLA